MLFLYIIEEGVGRLDGKYCIKWIFQKVLVVSINELN